MRHVFAVIFPLLFVPVTYSQFGFEFDGSLPVIRNSQQLENPWAGGLNYVQVWDIDYDFDGDLDLFIFDRSHDNIRVLINEDTYYRYEHNAKDKFPADVRYRAQLIDYDADGRKDLFTYGIGGMMIYRNVGDASYGLQWELITDLLYSQYTSGFSQLYVSSTDIPAIADIDFDGDTDILTFHQGGQHVEYHQNQSMELYGIPDSLKFELKNECWGKFTEEFSTNVVVLNDPNVPCEGGDIPNPLRISEEVAHHPKHAGSTLFAIDYDNSGVMDIILGDVSYSSLSLLINGGSSPNTNSAMISQDNNFPSNTTPIDLQLFPSANYLDVDFDGKKDLVVGSNARNVSENVAGILFYKNIGTNSNPTFTYVARNLFQNEMIDHGTASIPVIFDWNEDGLKDLIVSNFHRYKPVLDRDCAIAYYRNTGTALNPQFTFVDDDMLNLSQSGYGLHLTPTFGDIDNDGDEDMILGLEDGSLAYFENTSIGSGAVFGSPVLNYTDNLGSPIFYTGYVHPQLFDLNKDNLLDLIIGRKNGEIVYYQNIGTLSSPSFELHNPLLGNIDVSTTTPDGFAAPHFFRHNDTTHLFLGSIDGNLIYYDSIDGNLDPGFNFRLISDNYRAIEVEAYSSFAMNDLDNDGLYNLFVGQDLGGIMHFEADPLSTADVIPIEKPFQLSVYPNPTTNNLQIEGESLSQVQVYDLNGKLILSQDAYSNHFILAMGNIDRGIYLLRVSNNEGQLQIRRIIKN